MLASDVIKRVQNKLGDPDATYITDDLVLGHIQGAYDDLYNELRLAGFQWDQMRLELPGVASGTPNLSQYQATGKPLAALVQPRYIEWKLTGMDPTNYRLADGPLDAVRDVPVGGAPRLDSWAWLRGVVYLANFNAALDLRITGEFLFDPITGVDNQVAILRDAGQALVYLTCESIGDALPNPGWSTKFGAKAADQVDLLKINMTRANQAKTRRVGRVSNRSRISNPLTIK